MKLSIITVNFNNRDGLQRTIDSVVCQTWRDFEWIIIDGGSTDGSKELIEQYQDHFAYWCSEPDKGIYNAMNKGIDKAKGEYLNFMNSGDCFFDKNTLSQVFEDNIHADILAGHVARYDNGELIRGYHRDVILQLYKNTLNHQGSFIKSSLLRELRYDENLKIVSDWKFWIEAIIWKGATVEYLDFIVAIQEMDGVSTIPSNLQDEERAKVLSELYPLAFYKRLVVLDQYEDSRYVQRLNRLMKKSRLSCIITKSILKMLSIIFE